MSVVIPSVVSMDAIVPVDSIPINTYFFLKAKKLIAGGTLFASTVSTHLETAASITGGCLA